MQRLSFLTETVLSNKINRNRIVLSFKDSPRKPLGRRPSLFFRLEKAGSVVMTNNSESGDTGEERGGRKGESKQAGEIKAVVLRPSDCATLTTSAFLILRGRVHCTVLKCNRPTSFN